jgi:hypothetical protein
MVQTKYVTCSSPIHKYQATKEMTTMGVLPVPHGVGFCAFLTLATTDKALHVYLHVVQYKTLLPL